MIFYSMCRYGFKMLKKKILCCIYMYSIIIYIRKYRNGTGRVRTFNDDNGYKLYILCCEQIVYAFYSPQDNHFSNYKKKWRNIYCKELILNVAIALSWIAVQFYRSRVVVWFMDMCLGGMFFNIIYTMWVNKYYVIFFSNPFDERLLYSQVLFFFSILY